MKDDHPGPAMVAASKISMKAHHTNDPVSQRRSLEAYLRHQQPHMLALSASRDEAAWREREAEAKASPDWLPERAAYWSKLIAIAKARARIRQLAS